MRSNSSLTSDRRPSFTERARQEQILRAATELLAEGGYSAASLSAIADRIGSSKGVISYHFDGKDDLLRHVVTSVLTQAAAFMRPRVDEAASPPAKLRAYVGSNMQFLDEHRVEIRAVGAVLTGLPPEPNGLPAYSAAGRDAVDTLAELLRAGQRTGDFRDFEPSVVARSLRAAIDAVSDLLRIEPDLDVRAYTRDLLALFEPGVLT